MSGYFLFPCHKDNTDNRFYNGTKSILDNKCKKCEYVSSLAYFMMKTYKNYALERCCDMESSKESQPEAIFINQNQETDKIAIEVKTLHELYYANIEKDDKEKRRRKYLEKRILDEIGNRVYTQFHDFLIKSNLSLPPELLNLFLYGLLLNIYVDAEYKEINGYRHRISKSVTNELLSYKGKKENELLGHITNQIIEHIIYNLKVCLKGDFVKYKVYNEFKIGKLNFTIGKTSKEDSLFMIRYSAIESGSSSFFYPHKDALDNRINKYLNECKDKFSNYMTCGYKRILLIVNETHYFRDKIVNSLKKIDIPEYIDEVWCSFYKYEDIWDEELEDFNDQEIVDIEYIKIFESSC